jgi:guanylate kinase
LRFWFFHSAIRQFGSSAVLYVQMTTVFIISAPSGSGKSTLVSEIRRSVENLAFSISYTTRKPRGSEKDGREYHFVSREEFEAMRDRGEFLEWADVFGNYYGTAKRYVDEAKKAGQDPLLDIDVQGAAQIKAKLPEAVSIFILPPDRKILEWRLRRRSEDSEEVIQRRLATATREIENYSKYDYILVNENDRLPQSIQQLSAVVSFERAKRSGSPVPIAPEVSDLAQRCLRENVRSRAEEILASFAV